jgi:hypothetical protein
MVDSTRRCLSLGLGFFRIRQSYRCIALFFKGGVSVGSYLYLRLTSGGYVVNYYCRDFLREALCCYLHFFYVWVFKGVIIFYKICQQYMDVLGSI